MSFYHASVHIYQPGQIVSINGYDGNATFDHQNRKSSQKEINLLFDQNRPEALACSRVKSIYVFDNMSDCRGYANTLHIPDIHIYEVDPLSVCGGFPMCLLDIASQNINNSALVQKIISEYWQPTHSWNVKEYLTSEVIIIKECHPYTIYDTNPYMEDRDLAKKWISRLSDEKK